MVVVKVLSFALDLAFLSFGFETSPHCEMVPGADGSMVSRGTNSDSGRGSSRDSEGAGVRERRGR